LNTGDAVGDPKDPRKCIIQSLAIETAGRPDITVDLTGPHALDQLKNKPFTIKEGSKFRTKAVFQVHHEVLSGLKYLQVVKRKGIRVSKDEEMLVRTVMFPARPSSGWDVDCSFLLGKLCT
jgi:Rho GDP-dissociation inhibitor